MYREICDFAKLVKTLSLVSVQIICVCAGAVLGILLPQKGKKPAAVLFALGAAAATVIPAFDFINNRD